MVFAIVHKAGPTTRGLVRPVDSQKWDLIYRLKAKIIGRLTDYKSNLIVRPYKTLTEYYTSQQVMTRLILFGLIQKKKRRKTHSKMLLLAEQ